MIIDYSMLASGLLVVSCQPYDYSWFIRTCRLFCAQPQMLESNILMSLFMAISILCVFIIPASLSRSASLEVISSCTSRSVLALMVGHDLLYVLLD